MKKLSSIFLLIICSLSSQAMLRPILTRLALRSRVSALRPCILPVVPANTYHRSRAFTVYNKREREQAITIFNISENQTICRAKRLPIKSSLIFLTKSRFKDQALYGTDIKVTLHQPTSSKSMNAPCQDYIFNNVNDDSDITIYDVNLYAHARTFLENEPDPIFAQVKRKQRHPALKLPQKEQKAMRIKILEEFSKYRAKTSEDETKPFAELLDDWELFNLTRK